MPNPIKETKEEIMLDWKNTHYMLKGLTHTEEAYEQFITESLNKLIDAIKAAGPENKSVVTFQHGECDDYSCLICNKARENIGYNESNSDWRKLLEEGKEI